ncbi:MAG: RagB/SusD family nutrient uptake outer membrane protein, partial [Prevotella sp.]|nr:RagB/SusD family nutrient uptake outer membrane protein [Prevotella sp.]
MKTLLYVLPAAMLALTSCTDYIDIDAENTIDVDAIDYTDASTMHEAATGAYATLRIQGIHWANAMIWMGRDDDMSSGRADDQGDALKFGYPGGYTNPNAFWAVGNMWSTMYNIIIDCNSNIDALDQYAENLSTGSTDYQNYLQYKGEVRVVRAWAYYQLVTNFGPCVIYRDNTQNSFRRSTVEKVYDYIITEMQEAAAGMEAKRPNQMSRPGAFTKYTAEALAARTALLAGNFALVESLTDDIINGGGFELYPDYYNLFKIPGKLCNENLMEVQCSDFGTASGDYVGVDQWFNFRGAGLTLYDEAGNWSNGIGGWTFMRYSPKFLELMENRGETIRKETSLLVAGTTTREGWTINGDLDRTAEIAQIYDGKGYVPFDQMTAGNSEWGRNNNVRLIRYAEVLLMNAEAKVRQGKNGDAP